VRDFYGAFCFPSDTFSLIPFLLPFVPFLSETHRFEALRRREISERMYGNRKGEQA